MPIGITKTGHGFYVIRRGQLKRSVITVRFLIFAIGIETEWCISGTDSAARAMDGAKRGDSQAHQG